MHRASTERNPCPCLPLTTALNQLCRILRQQAGSGTSKKSSSEPYFQIWSSFLSYWQEDPALKDIVAVWERGDQAGNNPLTVAALQTYTTLLNIASLPSSGIIALGSPYQSPLAKLINELVKLLHYLHKYFRQSGQNDLATAGLELVGALLKIARFTPARNTTSRKIWQALELEAKDVCRLLGTKRKVPMITKQGRRPGEYVWLAMCRLRSPLVLTLSCRHSPPHALHPSDSDGTLCLGGDQDRHPRDEGCGHLHLEGTQ